MKKITIDKIINLEPKITKTETLKCSKKRYFLYHPQSDLIINHSNLLKLKEVTNLEKIFSEANDRSNLYYKKYLEKNGHFNDTQGEVFIQWDYISGSSLSFIDYKKNLSIDKFNTFNIENFCIIPKEYFSLNIKSLIDLLNIEYYLFYLDNKYDEILKKQFSEQAYKQHGNDVEFYKNYKEVINDVKNFIIKECKFLPITCELQIITRENFSKTVTGTIKYHDLIDPLTEISSIF